MNYERGLVVLGQQATGTSWYKDFLLYEASLRENLADERRFGTNQQIRSDRMRIVDELNRLVLDHLGIGFNQLCVDVPSSSQGPTAPVYGRAEQTDEGEHSLSATASKPSGNRVFISYSHKDRHYLEALRTHLAPYIRNKTIEVWDDTQIPPGAQWRDEIERELQAANVAVLLVSADFLASDSIVNNELTPLLTAAKGRGVLILPVILRACAFDQTDLARFQAVNKSSNPLNTMTRAKQDAIWVRVTESIRDALKISE